MAHLACVGSHAINGVAALHTELPETERAQGLPRPLPERFSNKTNGVTPRRFLVLANPGWRRWSRAPSATPGQGSQRAQGAGAAGRRCRVPAGVARRQAGQQGTAGGLHPGTDGIELDPDWLFDIQVKRIHEYKRQHLNVLHIITLYNRLRGEPHLDLPPRAFIFGGKAAPAISWPSASSSSSTPWPRR